MGNSPWSHKELDKTERLTCILFLICVGQEKWNRKKKKKGKENLEDDICHEEEEEE